MILKLHALLLVTTLSIAAAEEYTFHPVDLDEYEPITDQEDVIRYVRSIQPGGPTFPANPNLNGWKNTQGRIKSGGSFRYKRSPEEEKEPNGWKLKPDVFGDQHGNTQTSVGVQHKGDDHTVNAEWNKVVHGPSKAKPTWHVGGSFRFKRSTEEEESIADLDENEPTVYQDNGIRQIRSIQPGGPAFPKPNNNGWKVIPGRIKSGGSFRYKRSPEEEKEPNGWKVKPDVFGDQHGNTQTSVGVQHKGDDHTVNAEWNKVVHGPSKAKPTWHVGGSFRFKRSPEEKKEPNGWKVKPDVFGDQHGNTQTSVGVQHKGDAHTVNAEWNKVVHGPSKAKPTWHVGGAFRFKRSPEEESIVDLDENEPIIYQDNVIRQIRSIQPGGPAFPKPNNNGWKVIPGRIKSGGSFRYKRSPEEEKEPNGWKVKPDVFGDQHGNTQTSVGVQHKGDAHTVNAEWNKVVHGPSKAKPTWHVGGAFRFKRSPEEEESIADLDENEPIIYQDNVIRQIRSIQPGGPAFPKPNNNGWKVIPGRIKSDGSFRYKRSPEEEKEPNGWKVKPDVFGDQHGNTQTSVGVQHKGDDHTVNAEWNKVVHGPSKAKPTWHVGGSFRF